ncbi:tetratricopeptide repeat protein [Clostridium homopropionicum DSM 5847]|uniref:Tetratricopeptide repeat protein n=1 Tax=Clostridium homopropionicum DSM 5847 TaxID=1121318 RepID=A0A0L6ZBC8_9CLOT|nr:capsular biosynthesis protein [Clostridium homopropionicum]KOA20262.1 tetratricopeptide repeat protein [Clostridium homopropionicum DSM 5847]SFG57208.1 hypothetical protein SAMN04488501_1113 [Clostridium homopropionicum]
MTVKTEMKNKLSLLLFLEVKKERIESIFKIKINEVGEFYLPIVSENIIEKVNKDEDVSSIPVGFFIEGMFYVLGADEEFKYNRLYLNIINNVPNSKEYIKGKIAELVKLKKYEDGYILLKGLSKIEATAEIYEKLINLLENLRSTNDEYIDEEIEIIEEAKEIKNFALPYYYEGIIKQEKGDYEGALYSINSYISAGGKKTEEVLEFKSSLNLINAYKNGKELVYEDPEKALGILIPLLNQMGDSAEIYFYIAIGYRILENFNKAIYYLEKSIEIDNSFPEAFNELAINYACLEDFDLAIKYLRKVFEVTKSVEVCTNLVMCYLNSGDIRQAKIHLEIAKTLDKNDEVVKELEQILNELKEE